MKTSRALRTLRQRPAGITSTMTSSGFQNFLSYYQGDTLDLRGVTVSVSAQILVPSRNWHIRGGTFNIDTAIFNPSDSIIQISGAAGTNNSLLNTYSYYSIGSVAAGATSALCASTILLGYYYAYGNHSNEDRCVHNTSASDYHYYKGELVNVTSSNGSSIIFDRPLICGYSELRLSNTYRAMENLRIEDITVNGFNSTSSGCVKCLAIGATKGLTVIGSTFKGFLTNGLYVSFSRGIALANNKTETDQGTTLRYGTEISRCTGIGAFNLHSGAGRYGISGQGVKGLHAENCYFYLGADGDHGMGGDNIWFVNCKSDPTSGFWNVGNTSWHVGTRIRFVNLVHKTLNTFNADAAFYVYPNSSVVLDNCQIDMIKCRSYPSVSSNITGVLNPGPSSIILASGTIVTRGAFTGYASAGHTNSNYVIQHAYNDVVDASGSRLNYFELQQGAQMLCWTFGPPLSLKGVTSACTSIIRGTIGVNWDNASVPCIQTNGGTHTINVSGMTLLSSKVSLPSASTDIANIAAGTTSATVVLGSITVAWNGGSQQEVAATGRVNNGIGGSLTIQ